MSRKPQCQAPGTFTRRVKWLGLTAVLVSCHAGDCASSPAPPTPTRSSSTTLENPALPGFANADGAVTKRLRAALRAKGPTYVPRTHHLNPDGSPTYVNRLILETSPYLLQHAHNPVSWYAWSDEAFERARREGKPVFLSIGYSTCHWCHVMEVESFEDEEVARYLNEHYIAIKVDREQRPDVDAVYMAAVQTLTGGGGWPMTLVVTPDRKPFFGGTYFPARTGDRGAGAGLLTILAQLAGEYAEHRDAVLARAQELSSRIASMAIPSAPAGMPDAALIENAAQSFMQTADPVWGGFGRAPKFPGPAVLELLLRYHRRSGDHRALDCVVRTLEQMARGGIYDQIGGGFHRYATDARWLVPHFEKMLYDNAQLVNAYLAAYQVTHREDFAQIARETLRYAQREMAADAGGFYSATDADSRAPSGRDEEGYFFTWSPAEIESLLGPTDAALANVYYGVTAAGALNGRSILHRDANDDDRAAQLGLTPEALRRRISIARERMYAARRQRTPPARDDKILTSWNGLMISAFARAAFVLNDPSYAAQATRAATYLLSQLRSADGRLKRAASTEQSTNVAFLDDYAFTIEGLLDLHEADADPRWLSSAITLQAQLDRHYADDARGGYFLTADDSEALLLRDKPSYDGAEPSGNSVELSNLLRLAALTSDATYRERAERAFLTFSQDLARSPVASPRMLAALDFRLDRPREVIIVAPAGGGVPEALVSVVRHAFLPNRTLTITREGDALARMTQLMPMLEGKAALHGTATAFVCEQGHCELPTSEPDVFARQLAVVIPLRRQPTP